MPLPKPKAGESKTQFIDRFMADSTAVQDFPDSSQRRAVAETQWDNRMNSVFIQANASMAQYKKENGRDYVVVPGVLLREMAIHGISGYSNGAELIPADEIEKSVNSWNGQPILHGDVFDIGHPTKSGHDQEVQNKSKIGEIRNAQIKGKKLHASLWFDIKRLGEVEGASKILEMIENGETLELSTAYGAAKENKSGVYNGIKYSGIQKDLVPDHLAVFTTSVGACSIADGCGGNRLNAKGDIINDKSVFDEIKDMVGNVLNLIKKGGRMANQERTRDDLIEVICNSGLEGLPEKKDLQNEKAFSICALNAIAKSIEAKKPEEKPEEKPEVKNKIKKPEEKPEEKPEMKLDKKMIAEAFGTDVQTMETIIANGKSEAQKLSEERERLTDYIVKNSSLTKDVLASTPIEVLRNMTSDGQVDYSIQNSSHKTDDVPMPESLSKFKENMRKEGGK